METQNKQWVCHPVLDHSGVVSTQLGPEDLSSSGRMLSGRPILNENDNKITNNEQQVISDIQNKNGLDQFLIQQVEDAICENSRQTILRILDNVARLTSVEKLLLYLKLPTDMTTISDPLRQPLNPLGSRTEISQTIMWIRTHLEEDPELSLPKQEVYNEYTIHCANNKMKPLSTADFGKVMKQVYPSVRPRRLGTRGNSRYCYAGLRKRFKLEVPELPVLGDRPQSTEIFATQNDLTSAACTIICDWAESVLGTRFQSVYLLASYLVNHAPQNVNINSGAAAIVADYADRMQSKEPMSQELLPYSNHVNLKHKEAQLHLQRKLQQREFKRKLQTQSPKTEPKVKCKKNKLQTPSRTVSLDSMGSESPKSQGYQLNIVCDKSTNENTIPTLPDFSSFHQKKTLETTENIINDKPIIKKDSSTDKLIKPSTSTQVSRSNSLENEIYEQSDENIMELKPNFAGKLPIPRLPNQKVKTLMQSPKSVVLHATKKGSRSLKYKAIQPKPIKENNGETGIDIQIAPDDSLKNADYLTRERLISVSQVDKDALDDYLHGGSNSQEQEEELMQYFKNNETQQQQPLPTNNNNQNTEQDDLNHTSKSDKLSQLRLLLEQNLNQNISGIMSAPQTPNETINASKCFNKPSQGNFSTIQHPVHTHLTHGAKRRVSFEKMDDPVPPSPNTRRKNFSFTPISPGPHSPGGRQSKCNSTNASPFVSPRNTPVPRSKVSHVQSQVPASFVAQQLVSKHIVKPILKPILKHDIETSETDRIFSDLIEEKHFVNPTDIMPKCNLNLPMSAPPSPMLPYKQKMNSNLLQKLLDGNKDSYTTHYEKNIQNTPKTTTDALSQEVTQLMTETQSFIPTENAYRSQSVPLHQMTSFKTLMSPCLPNNHQQTHFNFNFTSANNSVAPTPVPTEFSDFDGFNEINNSLNTENLNQILNILETQPNQIEEPTSAASITNETTVQVTENVFNFDPNATALLNDEVLNTTPLIRSQSIDIDMELRGFNNGNNKYIQPSRSVPSTPLPYSKSKLQLQLNLNNNQADGMSGNLFNEDYLLNGQPVKKIDFMQTSDENQQQFPPNLGFTMNEPMVNDNNKMNFSRNEESFGARRNINPLLEQFPEDDFTPAVPSINSGTS